MKRWWACYVEKGDHCPWCPSKGGVHISLELMPHRMFVGSAATHKPWQKQPLPLHGTWVWLLAGCEEEEEKGLCVGWVWAHLEPTVCRRTISQQSCTMDRHHWKAAKTANGRGEKNIAKGRGKGEIPLVSKATPAYSIFWPHKTLFSRQKNPLLYLHEIITKCQALHTVLCVKRRFKESQIHLSSTIHITKITTVETKQTECLCSLVLQPAFGHSHSPLVSGQAFHILHGLGNMPKSCETRTWTAAGAHRRTRGFKTNKTEF